MIVFRPPGFVKNRLKPRSNQKQLLSEEKESNHSDYSDAESEKVKKLKKSRKLAHEKWSGSLICKLIDEYEVLPCLWNIF